MYLLLHLVGVVSVAVVGAHACLDDLVWMHSHDPLEGNALAILWWYDYLGRLHAKSIWFHGLMVG